MHARLTGGLGTILALVLAGVAVAQAPLPTLKPGDGRETVQALCTRCHAIGLAIARPHTADEWDEIIGKMIDKGMLATDDQLDEVAAYLTKYYGPSSTHGDASSPAAGPPKSQR